VVVVVVYNLALGNGGHEGGVEGVAREEHQRPLARPSLNGRSEAGCPTYRLLLPLTNLRSTLDDEVQASRKESSSYHEMIIKNDNKNNIADKERGKTPHTHR